MSLPVAQMPKITAPSVYIAAGADRAFGDGSARIERFRWNWRLAFA